MTMSHDEVAETLGAYALDAVDPDEAEAIEVHLVDCPRCRDELARYREVAAALAFEGASAPEALWDRIVESLESAPPAEELAKLYPLNRRRTVSARLVAAVGAVAASLVIGLGWQVHTQARDVSAIRKVLPSQALEQAVRSTLLDPGSSKVHLQSDDRRTSIDAVVSPDGSGYLVANDLPALTANRTYQLWGLIADRKVSLGILGARPSIAAFRVAAPVVALAVTAESAGGVAVSDQRAVVVGFVDPSPRSPVSTLTTAAS